MAGSAASRKIVPYPAASAGSAVSPWRDPGPGGEHLEIEDFPTFLFSRLATLTKSKIVANYLDRAKLSLPEWRLLTFVAIFSPTSYPQLAQRMAMDKAQLSLTLRTLVARGWVTWAEASAKDRSQRRAARIVTITPRGRATIRKIMPDARRAQMKLLDRLPREDRVELHRLLQKAVSILDGLETEDSD
jgi:DNA-binding MarR family transcriptional regulator